MQSLSRLSSVVKWAGTITCALITCRLLLGFVETWLLVRSAQTLGRPVRWWTTPTAQDWPFAVLLALSGVATGILWRRSRSVPSGHCPCGYDLIAPGEAWERRKRCNG